MDRLWYVHTIEYYPAMRMSSLQLPAMVWMKLIYILSKMQGSSQHMIPSIKKYNNNNKKGEADLSCWKSEEWLFLGQIVTRGDSQIKFKTTTTTREVISVKYMKRRSYRPMRMSSSFKAPKIRTDKIIKEQNSQRRTASIS